MKPLKKYLLYLALMSPIYLLMGFILTVAKHGFADEGWSLRLKNSAINGLAFMVVMELVQLLRRRMAASKRSK